jgi:hypothetical protein
MKTILSIAFLLTAVCASTVQVAAQNLVPNGDFEQHSGCPSAANQLDSCMYWMNTSPNVQNSGTPDYFNACDTWYCDVPNNPYYGYQVARSGNAYAGLLLYCPNFGGNIREYIEAPLTQPLIAGLTYNFQMYLSVPNNFMYTSDDIGVYFSDTAVTNVTNWLPLSQFSPQIVNTPGNSPDTTNWMLVSGTYQATGGEQFMIIGNFRNDFQTSVSMVNAGGNQYAYVYIDDVSLTTEHTGINDSEEAHAVTASPNPATDHLHLATAVAGQLQFTLFDASGKVLKAESFSGSTDISLGEIAPGIYYYHILNEDGVLDRGTVIRQ